MLFHTASIEAISKLLSNPTWDLLAILFFLAFGFFYGILARGKRLLAVLFSTYISILVLNNLFSHFSHLDFFTKEKELLEIFLFRSALLLTFIVLLGILFNKTIFRGINRVKKWWQIFILSFLETGLIISAILQLMPTKELLPFSPIVGFLFVSSDSFFWWLIIPLIALIFVAKKPKVD
ncbi:hypothetical protein ACFL1O_00815 [Patescibacteria group bacterium]